MISARPALSSTITRNPLENNVPYFILISPGVFTIILSPELSLTKLSVIYYLRRSIRNFRAYWRKMKKNQRIL
jgi:hypothetical protein